MQLHELIPFWKFFFVADPAGSEIIQFDTRRPLWAIENVPLWKLFTLFRGKGAEGMRWEKRAADG